MNFSNFSNEFETFTFHLLLWNHFAIFNQTLYMYIVSLATGFHGFFSNERKIIRVGQNRGLNHRRLTLQIFIFIIKSLYFNINRVRHGHHFEFCILVFDFFNFEPTMSQSRG